MKWRQQSPKHNFVISDCGNYLICWCFSRNRKVYCASYRKEIFLYTEDKQEAIRACKEHQKNEVAA